MNPTTYYTIQHRWTHESPWLKPKGKLKKRKDADWAFSSFDSFVDSFDPYTGQGNNWRPKYKVAHEEKYQLWVQTGCQGWTRLKHALRALDQVRKDDAEGKYDVKGTYGDVCQAARHDFRVVKCVYTPLEVEVVDLNDPGTVKELIR